MAYVNKRVALESVYKPRSPAEAGVPLCILDFRVAVHFIANKTAQFSAAVGIPAPPKDCDEEAEVAWKNLVAVHPLWPEFVEASWLVRLHRGPDMLPRASYRVIVVDDNRSTLASGERGYWRHEHASDYKGTRSYTKDDVYSSLSEAGKRVCMANGLPFYTEPLYEADDWAGLIHRIKKAAEPGSLLATRELYYSTVDSDWLQLVDDASRQLWANTGPWPSRLKNEAETRAYIKHRMGYAIAHPCEIAKAKQVTGDAADNLAVGASLHLFDLTSPCAEYDLAKTEHYARLVADLTSPDANTDAKALSKAVRWLSMQALPVCANP